MEKTYYVCKYTPLELLAAFGGECENLNTMPEGFDYADEIAHPNICGFGKSVLEAVLAGQVKELVLVNCCDTIRSVYDLLEDSGQLDFLYMLDMLHTMSPVSADTGDAANVPIHAVNRERYRAHRPEGDLHGTGNPKGAARADTICSRERVAAQLKDLAQKYGEYKGREFDYEAFCKAFQPKERTQEPHLAVLGARMGDELFEMTEKSMPLPVVNETCVNNRSVAWTFAEPQELGAGSGEAACCADFDALMDWYAGELLGQLPCMRMLDTAGRKQLYQDPSLKGIIYHTVKFCDFYSFEYADIKSYTDVPILKIESDYTVQSSGQLLTRLEAFAESLALNPKIMKNISRPDLSAGKGDGTGLDGNMAGTDDGSNFAPGQHEKGAHMGKGYFAGIDSGSTSTDVVILNKEKEIVAGIILPTGAGAAIGAERALEQALEQAHLKREDIDAVVTTGYGRTAIQVGDKSITEITCHARGAHFLNPSVRTVVDIGGQDSKVIRLDADGSVKNFVMNDKCAAGTGRFLEMMARTMEMTLDEIGKAGLSYDEDITISSMCTVFAESEVVSLIAQNKKPDDIVHGLNKAVAAKTAALVKRVGGEEAYMMTGGVAQIRDW